MKTIAMIVAFMAIPLLAVAEDEQPISDNLLARMNPYIAGATVQATGGGTPVDAILIEDTTDAILLEGGGTDKLMLEP